MSSYLKPHTSNLFFALLLAVNVFGQPAIGNKVKDIALKDVNGNVKKLSSYADKIVLIDFWASWCGPCRQSNPNLVRLHKMYNQKGFEIYSISIDEDKVAWKKAIALDKMGWTHVIENGGWDGPVASDWKIERIPASYLLDRSGKVIAIDPEGKELEQKIVEQLNK